MADPVDQLETEGAAVVHKWTRFVVLRLHRTETIRTPRTCNISGLMYGVEYQRDACQTAWTKQEATIAVLP